MPVNLKGFHDRVLQQTCLIFERCSLSRAGHAIAFRKATFESESP